MANDIYEQSLEFHKKVGGKLEIKSKISLKDPSDLSLAYTPGVARVSEVVGEQPEAAYTYTIKKNSVAVITDGSAILGLGNLGPLAALPVMEGKCILFKEFAGVDAFPICLDSQNMDQIVETVKNIAPVFGGINLEDISAPRCFEIESRLKAELNIPVMHDDQHGTAVVVLAALINALKLKSLDPAKAKVVINGAGAAGIAVSRLMLEYGFLDIIVCDSKGTIYSGRPDLNIYKQQIADQTNKSKMQGSLADALKGADIFIGVSVKDVLTESMIKTMATSPVVFALANPEPEVDPEVARSAGAFIVATGRSDFPNQINNVLAFPGIFRGALDNRVKQITSRMLVAAAGNLASYLKNPLPTQILPNPFDKEAQKAVAAAIKN